MNELIKMVIGQPLFHKYLIFLSISVTEMHQHKFGEQSWPSLLN